MEDEAMGSSRIWGYAIMAVVMTAVRYPFMFLLAVVCLPSFVGVLDWLNRYSPDPQDGIIIHVEEVVGENPDFWRAHDGSDGNPYVVVAITNNRTTPLAVHDLVCTLEGPVYVKPGNVEPSLSSTGAYVGVHKVLTEVYGEQHLLAPGETERRQFESGALVGTETGNCDWRAESPLHADTVIEWPTLTPKGVALRNARAINTREGGARLL
jgi:hypothetical protein